MKKLIALVLAFMSTGAYAGPSLNDQITLSVLPKTPIVILGDTRDSQGNIVRGPWFSNRILLRNESSQQVSVEAVLYSVVSLSTRETRRISFKPSDHDGYVTCPDGSRQPIHFTSYGRFLAGDSGMLRLKPDGFTTKCGDPLQAALFFAGDLPGSLAKYTYEVEIRVLGWFGNWDDPTDRLDKTFTFRTQ